MKNNKRLLFTLLAGTLMFTGATGCGAKEDTETADVQEVDDRQVESDSSEDAEDSALQSVSFIPDEDSDPAEYVPSSSEEDDQVPASFVPEAEEPEDVPSQNTSNQNAPASTGSSSAGSSNANRLHAAAEAVTSSHDKENTSSGASKDKQNTSSEASKDKQNTSSGASEDKENTSSGASEDKENTSSEASEDKQNTSEEEKSTSSQTEEVVEKEPNNTNSDSENPDDPSEPEADDENNVDSDAEEWQTAYIEFLQNLTDEFSGYYVFDLDGDEIPEIMTIRREHSHAEVTTWYEDELVTSEFVEYANNLEGEAGFTVDTENHFLYANHIVKNKSVDCIYILKDGKLKKASKKAVLDPEHTLNYYFSDLEPIDDTITDVIMNWEPEMEEEAEVEEATEAEAETEVNEEA